MEIAPHNFPAAFVSTFARADQGKPPRNSVI